MDTKYAAAKKELEKLQGQARAMTPRPAWTTTLKPMVGLFPEGSHTVDIVEKLAKERVAAQARFSFYTAIPTPLFELLLLLFAWS